MRPNPSAGTIHGPVLLPFRVSPLTDYDIDDGLPTSLLGSLVWLAALAVAAAVRRGLTAPESAKPAADDAAVFVPPSGGFW